MRTSKGQGENAKNYKGKQKMKFKYYNPVKIHFGVDFAEALKHIAQRENNILLVTTKRWRKQEGKIEQILGKKLARIIDEITPNPDIKHLQHLAQNMSDFDCIVAFGGGSVIDSAKFFSAKNSSLRGEAEAIHKNPVDCHESLRDEEFASKTRNDEMKSTHALRGSIFRRFCGFSSARQGNRTDSSIDEAEREESRKSVKKTIAQKAKPIYAFPTTSGTSSELTHWATVWDNAAFIKHSLSSEILYPKEAFYDQRLTLSVPRETTIHTALDALSHAFESIWNNNANPISTHHALCAIEIILRDLPALAENLHSLELRTSIMQASMHAGLAFSNTQTALAHALSYPLTMRFDTPHGLACSFSLPLLLDCLPKQSHAYALLSPFRARLLEVFGTLDISPNPKDYGLDSAFIDEIFATLNARAKNGIFDIERVQEYLLKNL